MDAIGHIEAVLKAFDVEPGPFDRILDSYNRRHRELTSAERRLVAEAAFGVMRWRPRLDGWLSMNGHRKLSNRMRALGYLLWKQPDSARIIRIEEMAAEEGIGPPFADTMPRSFPGGLSAFNAFPDFLYDMMIEDNGEDGAASLANSLNSSASPVLRCNSLRLSREEALGLLADEGIECQPTPHSPWGLILPCRANLKSLKPYREGMVEIQDEASQLTLACADPASGDTVLDACAGAGGKSLMAAMLMENSGCIIASDTDGRKLRELERRVRRAGVTIIETLTTDDLNRRGFKGGLADLVIVDAPCSGTGTMRRCPDLKWRLSPSSIEKKVRLQQELLCRYWEFVKPGGKLIYITCSILECENGGAVRRFIKGREASIADAGLSLGKYSIQADQMVTHDGFFKTDPRLGNMDGFFAAVIVKDQVGASTR